MNIYAGRGIIRFLFISVLVTLMGPTKGLALDISGIINTDSRWTMDDSPITITGDLLVAQGVTLTIDPGVQVLFKARVDTTRGYNLQVQGTLLAQGTAAETILFTAQDPAVPWGAILFEDVSTDWSAGQQTGSRISRCVIEYGGNASDGGMIVTRNAMPLIRDNAIRFSVGAGIVAGSDEVADTVSGDLQILDNWIYGNIVGLVMDAEGGGVTGNYFLYNESAMDVTARFNDVTIQNNTVVGSVETLFGSGIRLELGEPAGDLSANILIRHNTIVSDGEGTGLVALTAVEGAQYQLSFSLNNLEFVDTQGYAVYLYDWDESTTVLNMSDNWWGSKNVSTIKALIYDQADEFQLPSVTYQPIVVQPINAAGSDLDYPPLADAGPDLETTVDATVTLDGSQSYDPDGIGTYVWEQTEGETVTIRSSKRATATFVAPSGGADGQVLRFSLTVSAGGTFTHTDEVVVTIDPDESVPVVEVGGGCFIDSTIVKSSEDGRVSEMMIIAMLAILSCLVFGFRKIRWIFPWAFVVASVVFIPSSHAGFFAVGGGGGGEADQYNITLETGAKDITAGNVEMMFAFGIPFIPHGDKNLPDNTLAIPCPNDQCQSLGEERKGTEVGFYGKLGIEIGSTNLYCNLLGGFTAYTESQLAQGPGSGAIYEQSSDTTLEPLYGAGFSYFPDVWKWPILLQVDWDITRGVTGTVGWYW